MQLSTADGEKRTVMTAVIRETAVSLPFPKCVLLLHKTDWNRLKRFWTVCRQPTEMQSGIFLTVPCFTAEVGLTKHILLSQPPAEWTPQTLNTAVL